MSEEDVKEDVFLVFERSLREGPEPFIVESLGMKRLANFHSELLALGVHKGIVLGAVHFSFKIGARKII